MQPQLYGTRGKDIRAHDMRRRHRRRQGFMSGRLGWPAHLPGPAAHRGCVVGLRLCSSGLPRDLHQCSASRHTKVHSRGSRSMTVHTVWVRTHIHNNEMALESTYTCFFHNKSPWTFFVRRLDVSLCTFKSNTNLYLGYIQKNAFVTSLGKTCTSLTSLQYKFVSDEGAQRHI
ncbi:hypothetical protein FOCC_FOCC002500 [Frankliniella occidentalis]|nr:hypothetical protein FOCC_FOCC002500 [Frankliniella occidentalis]